MGQIELKLIELFEIEQLWPLNCVLMLNWIILNRSIFTFKLCTVWNRTVYMSKMDLVLDNLQWLIWYNTKPNQDFFTSKVLKGLSKYI